MIRTITHTQTYIIQQKDMEMKKKNNVINFHSMPNWELTNEYIRKKTENKIDNGWKWNMRERYSKFHNSVVIVAKGRLKRWHIHTQQKCWKCKKEIYSLSLLLS